MVLLGLLVAALTPAIASPLHPRQDANSDNVTEIKFRNNTAYIDINVGTPAQTIPVELSLGTGALELSGFNKDASSSFIPGNDSTPIRSRGKDTVIMAGQTLPEWEFHLKDSHHSELGGELPLSSSNDSTSVGYAVAKAAPNRTLSLSFTNSSGSLALGGGENSGMDWWHPLESSGDGNSWALIIDGVAVDGERIVVPDERVNNTKRQATPTAIASAQPTSPAPMPWKPSGECVVCAMIAKSCSCQPDETCVRHKQTCNECEFIECVKNKTTPSCNAGQDPLICPMIYHLCNCKDDETCVRHPQTCNSCERVECRKNTGSEPPVLTEPEPPADNGTEPQPPTNNSTEPQPPTNNCTLLCPAIYKFCNCHADETCVRHGYSCEACPWIECVKDKPTDDGNGTCVTCDSPEPECECDNRGTCVRTPRSCNDCGKVECRTEETGVKFALSLSNDITVELDLAKAVFAKIPGASIIGDPPVEPPTPTSLSFAPGTTGVSVAPPVEGRFMYAVPCNTTASITFLFPKDKSYTLPASDWVVPGDDGCRAALVAEDVVFGGIIAGTPFLRTVDTALRIDDNPAIGFAPVNKTTVGIAAAQGTSDAGAMRVSWRMLLLAIACVWLL